MSGMDSRDVRGLLPAESSHEGLKPQAAWEVGLVIRTLRSARGWSQEDLARAARLAPRSVQRAELGEVTTRDERSALAKSLGLANPDEFERPLGMPDRSAIEMAFSKLDSKRVSLPLRPVATGQELSELVLVHPLDIFLHNTFLEDAARSLLDELVAATRDFRELADLHDEVERRTAVGRLQVHLDTSAAMGIRVACGVRHVELELEAPSGQLRWNTSVLYLLAFKGECPESLEA
jgi:transcriptional regulator with XRE-family HTH domain